MEEWVKFHTYVVCNTKRSAKGQMIEDYWYYCQRFGWKNFINMNRSKLRIESKHKVRQYVSVQQVLHYFDGVDDVDRFEIADSVSDEKAEIIIRIVRILKNASTSKFLRAAEREKYYKEHNF